MLTGNSDEPQTWLKRISLAERNSTKDEKWLQELLFANSDLIPIQQINLNTKGFVPVCRELTIPKTGSSVFLDIFGVTPEGKLVLIECKLWRNPQARREVIAQILEYASLLHQWTYGDLTSRIKTALNSSETNPLFSLVAERFPEVEEARFVDQVSTSLRTGNFDLIIAGDGIRSDVQSIADHLNQSSGLSSRMALVEFQLWENSNNDLIVIPFVPVKTELIKHRVFATDDGSPITFSTPTSLDEIEKVIDPNKAAQKSFDRVFWQTFIDNAQFDHPDQLKPRHGGQNWVRLELPKPANWLTAFRAKDKNAGFFISLKNEDGERVFAKINAAKQQLETDLGFEFEINLQKSIPFEATISFNYENQTLDDDALMKWLLDRVNRITNTFRPFISQIN